MRATILLLSVLLLAGCARRGVKVPPAPTALPGGSGAPGATAAWDHRIVAFQGRSAIQWSQRLNTRDVSSREQAATALAAMKDDGLPHLLAGMNSHDWEVRLSCLQAMPKPLLLAQAAQTRPLLIKMLRDPNPLVRQQAAARVTWFGAQARAAIPELERMARSDDNADVRQTAADAVVDMRTSVAELTQLLRDASPLVRRRAAEDLGALEAYSRGALPALDAVSANDPDPAVREAASAAVRSIRGGGQ